MCRHVSVWGFQNRVSLSICPYPEKRNHRIFVNISPTIVIDTSMDRSSRVLQHGNIKICFFFNLKLNFDLYFVWLVFFLSSNLNFDLYFDLCQRDEIIQVGLNMHLYDDIRDASSSLRGSTSSSTVPFTTFYWVLRGALLVPEILCKRLLWPFI